MKHIIAVLLENEAGALSRVVGLFSARGYNIESLTVAPTEDPSPVAHDDRHHRSDDVIEQITKHLNRLIEVVKVVDLTEGAYTERELMLVKVRAVGKEREEMKRMADIFRGRIIDVTEKSYTIELTGDRPSSTPSWRRSTAARSWKPCAPAPAASARRAHPARLSHPQRPFGACPPSPCHRGSQSPVRDLNAHHTQQEKP
jgi:acetolactate synthase I/III small subunit